MSVRLAGLALFVAAGILACADGTRGDNPHPDSLTGRWIRLRPDNSWGDTMTFGPDGTLSGSQGYPVPPSLRWELKRDANGVLQYCAAQGTNGFCRNFTLSADTLRMFGGPRGNTTFRRVR